jgi:hypothetical protein
MSKVWISNQAVVQPRGVISVCRLLKSEKAKALIVTKWTNQCYVSDVTCVIERAVSTQYKTVWMTTVMLNSFTYPTSSISAQYWCTWLRYLKLLMVRNGYQGEGAGWGNVRTSSYNKQKLVNRSTCGILPAERSGIWQGHVISHPDKVERYWSAIKSFKIS